MATNDWFHREHDAVSKGERHVRVANPGEVDHDQRLAGTERLNVRSGDMLDGRVVALPTRSAKLTRNARMLTTLGLTAARCWPGDGRADGAGKDVWWLLTASEMKGTENAVGAGFSTRIDMVYTVSNGLS
jgi:hypothetical protein